MCVQSYQYLSAIICRESSLPWQFGSPSLHQTVQFVTSLCFETSAGGDACIPEVLQTAIVEACQIEDCWNLGSNICEIEDVKFQSLRAHL